MDERFYTPRASCISSRSNASFATPRASVSSSDSESVYRTPRSTQKSPAEPLGIHGHHQAHGRHRGGGHHDRSRDFRRFSDNASFSRRPASIPMPPSSYRSEGNKVSGQSPSGSPSANSYGKLEENEHSINIFSLSRHGREGEVEELLLRGVPVDSKDGNGNQILAIGCQNNKKRIVKLALRYGAEINAVNNSGNTALHFCTKYGLPSLGRYLLDKGADPNVRNNEGRLCTDVA